MLFPDGFIVDEVSKIVMHTFILIYASNYFCRTMQLVAVYEISYASATDLTSLEKLISWPMESKVTEETCCAC